MINFILGKSKTGKTSHIYNLIEEDLKNDINVILFVPSQSRAKAEEEYIKILGKNGVIGVNITTITEFIEQELKLQNLHIEEDYITKLDRKIILTQVIKENPDLFNIYSKVKNYPGFLDVLDIYMDLFRKSDINPEKISNLEIKDKRTNLKFKEVLSIYEKYLEKIKSRYIDSVEEVDIFISNIYKSEWFKDSSKVKVYFDSYNNFSNSEYKLIDKLLKLGIDVIITINTDIARIEDVYISSSIFEIPNKTYKRLCALANKNNVSVENIVKYENLFNAKEDIKYIASNLFKNSSEKIQKININNIEFVMYTNILSEINEVAKIISKKIKEGYRYSDFAIYTTNTDEYQNVIAKVFYENNLDIYIARNKKLSESILVKYIQGILNLSIKGLNLELIFDILKQGLTDIDVKDICLIENYMKEFNVNKYFIDTPFTLNNDKNFYDLEKLNSIKNKIVDMYSFVVNIKRGTSKFIIEQIYNHLNENNIFNNFYSIIRPLNDDIISLDKVNFEEQVWQALTNIFDSIVKVYKDEEISIEDFSNIFNLVVKDIKVSTLPPTKDRLELVDINVSKINPKKIAFFIGVVEGKFPESVKEDIIFNDTDLEMLKEREIDLRETTVTKLNMGYYNIYEALNNVSEKIYVTIPASTLDGKATRKSSLITLIEQIANICIKGKVAKKDEEVDIYDMTSKDELFVWFIKKLNSLDENDNLETIYNVYEYFKKDSEYSKILDFKKDDSRLSKEITDIVYSDEFKTSVSRLELYKKCPFSYFMQYILKVKPNKEARVNVLEIGSFMHGVLEEFSKELLEKNIMWQEILEDDLESIKQEYENILENIIYDFIDKNLTKQKQSVRYMVLKRKLTNTMKKVIKTVALSYNQSEFKPYGYEIEFKDNSAFLPMEIELENGKKMKIIGKIDRVDFLEFKDNIYIRVVDYKSSGKELKLDKIKEGISLQLISYMMAFMENKKDKKIIPAAMVYFNLSDKLVSLTQYEQDNEKIKKELLKKLKMNGIFLKDLEILNKMDRNFENNSKDSLIDVTKTSITRNSSKVLEEEEFENLCRETKLVLEQIGDELSSGKVKIAPNKKENYCQFCHYSSTCRKNIKV